MEVEKEIATLQPAYKELSIKIEESEQERQYLRGELDKLKRTSNSIRAEISQLRNVREAIETVPPPEEPLPDGSANADGVERFTALQWKLGTVAPQLLPLCARARSEMEDLTKCCRKLEERYRRLQQMVPCTDEGVSVSSAVNGNATSARVRARSTEALTARESCNGRGNRMAVTPRGQSPQRGSPSRYSDKVSGQTVYCQGNARIPSSAGGPGVNGSTFGAGLFVGASSREVSPRHPIERASSASTVRSRPLCGEGYATAWARNRNAHSHMEDEMKISQRARTGLQESPIHNSPGAKAVAPGLQGNTSMRPKSRERPGWRSPRAR